MLGIEKEPGYEAGHAHPEDLIIPASTDGTPSIQSDLDDSYGIYKGHGAEEIDPNEAKKVLRKIDLRVVPILFGTYLLQYLDKNGP